MHRCRCPLGHRFWRHLVDAQLAGHSLLLVRPNQPACGGTPTTVVDGKTGQIYSGARRCTG